MSTKIQGTCAYCLRPKRSLTRNGWLVRHGFVIRTQPSSGHVGAQHGGPCRGVEFKPYEVSCEGTDAALVDTRATIAEQREWLKQVVDRDVLLYFSYEGAELNVNELVELMPEDGERTIVFHRGLVEHRVVVPSYEARRKVCVTEAEIAIDRLTAYEGRLMRAIEHWHATHRTPSAEELSKAQSVEEGKPC